MHGAWLSPESHKRACYILTESRYLLARATQIARLAGAEVRAPWVDVQAAAPRITGIHGQLARLALAQHVHEDALDTLLMELVVLAEADQVFQQSFLLDLRADIADLHRAPVWLAGDQAVGLEQVRYQRLFDRPVLLVSLEQLRRRRVRVDLDVEPVQQRAFEFSHLDGAEI